MESTNRRMDRWLAAAKVNKSAWEFLKAYVLDADPKYLPYLVR